MEIKINCPTNAALRSEIEKLMEEYSSLGSFKNQSLQANWVACAACQGGLYATLAAAIVATIAGFPEDAPLIEAIAEACGISEDVASAIFAGAGISLSSVIADLCKAMHAC